MSDEPQRLALPAPDDIGENTAPTTLNLNSTVKLDKLGVSDEIASSIVHS